MTRCFGMSELSTGKRLKWGLVSSKTLFLGFRGGVGQSPDHVFLLLIRSIKELRDRVGSVKNTKKITSAMKLVAAAKVCSHTPFFCRLFLGSMEGGWGGEREGAES